MVGKLKSSENIIKYENYLNYPAEKHNNKDPDKERGEEWKADSTNAVKFFAYVDRISDEVAFEVASCVVHRWPPNEMPNNYENVYRK